MINVSVNLQGNTKYIKIEGHAMAGVLGEDLVCAAATILTRTLHENLIALKEMGAFKKIKCEIREGYAEFNFLPKKNSENTTAVIVKSILPGYKLLSDQYPENIIFRVWDRKEK